MTTPYELTKTDIAAMRQADDLVVAIDGDEENERRIQLIKRGRKTEKQPFAQDEYHSLSADCIRVRRSWSAIQTMQGVRCFAMVGLYHSQHTHASSVLGTLRAGDTIIFEFSADHHSNGTLARAKLHADVLLLIVRRKDRVIAEWELDHRIAPDNTARMVRGVAPSEWYKKEQAESV